MHIEPPSLVRQLDTLAAAGLVERRPDPGDRRVSRVHVTASGRRRLAQLNHVAAQFDEDLRAVLDPREIEVLGAALMRIHDQFGGATDFDAAARRYSTPTPNVLTKRGARA